MCYIKKCYHATVLGVRLGFFIVWFGFCFGGCLFVGLVFVVLAGFVCCFVVVVFLKAYNHFTA